jgi:hypothetical protein
MARRRDACVGGTASLASASQVQSGCTPRRIYCRDGKNMNMTTSIPQLTNMENKTRLSNLGAVVSVRAVS